MSMWRIRLALPGGPDSRAVLNEALAGQPVSQILLTPRGADTAELTGEVMLDLTGDEGLGALLSVLHTISPQVLVSRADEHAVPGQPETMNPRQRPGRRLSLARARAGAPNRT